MKMQAIALMPEICGRYSDEDTFNACEEFLNKPCECLKEAKKGRVATANYDPVPHFKAVLDWTHSQK